MAKKWFIVTAWSLRWVATGEAIAQLKVLGPLHPYKLAGPGCGECTKATPSSRKGPGIPKNSSLSRSLYAAKFAQGELQVLIPERGGCDARAPYVGRVYL